MLCFSAEGYFPYLRNSTSQLTWDASFFPHPHCNRWKCTLKSYCWDQVINVYWLRFGGRYCVFRPVIRCNGVIHLFLRRIPLINNKKSRGLLSNYWNCSRMFNELLAFCKLNQWKRRRSWHHKRRTLQWKMRQIICASIPSPFHCSCSSLECV